MKGKGKNLIEMTTDLATVTALETVLLPASWEGRMEIRNLCVSITDIIRKGTAIAIETIEAVEIQGSNISLPLGMIEMAPTVSPQSITLLNITRNHIKRKHDGTCGENPGCAPRNHGANGDIDREAKWRMEYRQHIGDGNEDTHLVCKSMLALLTPLTYISTSELVAYDDV